MTTKDTAKTRKPTKRPDKQRRRRMLTFARMFRYGVSNFSRNIWLTVAATAVMSVTLLIVFVTLVAREVLLETVTDISSKVDMSIYLAGSAKESDILEVKSRVEKLENVKSVRYISASQAREDQARQNKQDIETLEAIKEAANRLPATLRVYLEDINDTATLTKFVESDELYAKIRDPSKDPSFQGERRDAITQIAEWVKVAEIGGGVATLIFVVISSLVVFNTIRMAIFHRKDEIQMMKLIGAERGFIRGPFLVEATMYGFIAAIIATATGYGLVMAAKQPLVSYGIPLDAISQTLIGYLGVVFLAMLALGVLIGVISSYIATRRYLKI